MNKQIHPPFALFVLLSFGVVACGDDASLEEQDEPTRQSAVPERSAATGWMGNGHFYVVTTVPGGVSQQQAEDASRRAGGTLASITSAEENEFVFDLAARAAGAFVVNSAGFTVGPWLGGRQPPGSIEPDGAWSWVTGERWEYTAWLQEDPQPNDVGSNEDALVFLSLSDFGPTWGDYPANPSGLAWQVRVTAFVTEFEPE